ncbi:MAG TPA: PAS domain-containing protein [Devosia sp.]|nr:PAS domain-containing protein [Devosia sp.]
MGYSQNSLISAIYEMALGRANWDSILDILGAAFPDCLVLVSGHDLAKRSSLLFSQRGLTPEAVSTYLSHYADRNPWLEGTAELAPFQVYHDEQLLPREAARTTPFVSEWLVKQGDFLAATGVVILREGARQMSIEIRYPGDAIELRERAGQVLGEAAYHFGRAFEILKRARFSSGFGYLNNVVEDLPFAVFFVDTDMRIHYSNQHAEAMRRRGDGPFTGFEGQLRTADDTTDRQLRELVQKTAAVKRSSTSVLQLGQINGDQRYLAIARLASRGPQHYQLHDAILDPGPLVMLVIHGSLEVAPLPMDLLWRAFGLTESEATLAEALLSGSTLADFAQEREVSKQTLRNQLVGVMRKTGTRRQSELVSLLTRLSLTCL